MPNLGAGAAPKVRHVGRAVVGDDRFDDAAERQPGHRANQDAGCSGGGLVVVDLGVGDSGVPILGWW
jgi:hypothetical protein